MSETTPTPLKSEQGENGIASKSSGRNASSKTPISSANKDKKTSVHLTPVESLLFFNIVRFNKDPSSIDWDQVAKHSNLKNPSSAKVRFRQIQKKYGLEINSTNRQGKRKTLATATEDEDEGEDDEDTDESPSKKRSTDLSTHKPTSQSRPSRKRAVVQKELGSEDSAPASTATGGPVSEPDTSTKQDSYEQQAKDQNDPKVKQESPVRQVKMMNFSPTQSKGPTQNHRVQQQHQKQKQRGPERLSSSGSANGTYNMDGTQRSGVGMFRGMSPFQPASSMANSHQSQVLTPEQQAYLQNLQRLHHERVAQQGAYLGYGHGEPQSQIPAYTTQQARQYGQYGISPAYANLPQAYFNTQAQVGGVQPLTRAPTRAPTRGPTRASAQSSATSIGHDKPARSLGDDSFASGPESPMNSLFDEMVHMPDSATSRSSPAGKSTDLTSHDDNDPRPPTR